MEDLSMTKVVVGRCLLQDILNSSKLSQVDLSIKTGISTTQLSDYKSKNRVMSLKNARVIAQALNCNMDDLYEWLEE